MAIRKNVTNENLAKVLEFSITELQKDLEKYSIEEKKLLSSHASFIQKELNKDVLVNTEKLENLVSNFEKRFGQKIEKHVVALEKQKKEMRIFYISLGLFFLSIVILFFSYLFGIKGAEKVRVEYYNDLKSEGIIIENKSDIEFLKKWNKWSKENPKDSQKINEIINK